MCTGPSGCGRAIAAALAEGGGAYKVAVPWSEVGRHSVAITLHGAHVAGSPFTIDAITQARLCPRFGFCFVCFLVCGSKAARVQRS